MFPYACHRGGGHLFGGHCQEGRHVILRDGRQDYLRRRLPLEFFTHSLRSSEAVLGSTEPLRYVAFALQRLKLRQRMGFLHELLKEFLDSLGFLECRTRCLSGGAKLLHARERQWP